MEGRTILNQKYYTVAEAMEILQISRPTVSRWLKIGQLKGMKKGNKWLFTEQDLKACIVPGTYNGKTDQG